MDCKKRQLVFLIKIDPIIMDKNQVTEFYCIAQFTFLLMH
jgi:hypothetical protein